MQTDFDLSLILLYRLPLKGVQRNLRFFDSLGISEKWTNPSEYEYVYSYSMCVCCPLLNTTYIIIRFSLFSSFFFLLSFQQPTRNTIALSGAIFIPCHSFRFVFTFLFHFSTLWEFIVISAFGYQNLLSRLSENHANEELLVWRRLRPSFLDAFPNDFQLYI